MFELVSQPVTLERLAFKKLAEWAQFQVRRWMHELRPQHFDKRNQCAEPKDPGDQESELTEQEEQLVDRQMKFFQNHIRILNSDYQNKLLDNIMFYIPLRESGNREKKIWWQQVFTSLVKTFFTCNLTALKLKECKYFSTPLCSWSHLLTRLTHLELELSVYTFTCKYGHSVEDETIQILKPLQQLKYLAVKYQCTENILKCVVEHCPLVEELKISQSRKQILEIDDRVIHLLVQLKYLRRLYVRGTSIGPNEVEELLFNCENLEYIDVSRLLDHLDHDLGYSYTSIEKSALKVSKLKTFSTGASLKQVKLLVEICPHIQHMEMSVCTKDDECNLKALSEFKNISQLKLVGYHYYKDGVTETLQDIGRSLTDLHLNEIEQIDIDALKTISQVCPNLQSLSLAHFAFLERPSSYGQLEIAPFRKLKRLYYQILRYRQEIPLLEFLLCNCLDVEYIDILSTDIDVVSEGFMLDVLDHNPLKCLERLFLTKKIRRISSSRAKVEQYNRNQVPIQQKPDIKKLVLDRLLQGGSQPEVIQKGAGWCLPLKDYHRPPNFPRI